MMDSNNARLELFKPKMQIETASPGKGRPQHFTFHAPLPGLLPESLAPRPMTFFHLLIKEAFFMNREHVTTHPIKFHCPHCDVHLGARSELSGKPAECPQCGHSIEVPVESEGTEETANVSSRNPE